MKWIYRKTLCYNIQCYFCNSVSISCIASFSQSYCENLLEDISEQHKGDFCFFSKVTHGNIFKFSNIIIICYGTTRPEKITCCSVLNCFPDFLFFFSSPLTDLFFQASGTTNLLLSSPDNNNVLILHLLNIYVFWHQFAKVLWDLLNYMVNAIPS